VQEERHEANEERREEEEERREEKEERREEKERREEEEERQEERNDDADDERRFLYCIEGVPHYSRRFLPHKVRYQCQFSDGVCCPNGETCCPRDSACRPDGKCIRPFNLRLNTNTLNGSPPQASEITTAKSAALPIRTPAAATQPIGKTVEHSMTVIDNNNHVSVREAVAPH